MLRKIELRRMRSSVMSRRVAHVRTDVSEECIASIIRVERVSELGTLAVTNNFLRRPTRRHVTEDDILHSHRRENLKSYITLTG
jgi:hypothetical protein